jgi:hypothetical protein
MSRMSSRRDPVRLTESQQTNQSELAAAIRQLRCEQGSPGDVQALEQRLAAKLGSSALGAAEPSGSNPRGSLSAMTWTAVTLAALGALFGLSSARLAQPTERTRTPVQLTRAELISAPAPQPPPARAQPQPAQLPPTPPARAGATPSTPPRRALPVRAPSALGPAPRAAAQDPAGELSLLRRARVALRGRDSNAALEFVDQHLHDYPRGIFAQEREVLAVQALLKTHQRSEALVRAQNFIRDFPQSSYTFWIRNMLEQSPRAAPSILAGAAMSDEPASADPQP